MTCPCAQLALLVCLFSAQQGEAGAPASPSLVTSKIAGRVLKHFDFDERRFGNYESMPRGWAPISGPGYPHFGGARFDGSAGHEAAPSFRFDLSGGNVGAVFLDRSINVHPDSDYEISAWIRTTRMEFARAFVTAVLIDHAEREIVASRCTSPMVSSTDGQWQCVRMTLHGGFAKARWMGLSCRVERIPIAEGAARAVQRQTVDASVWFDDIVVTRLPRVELDLEKASALFHGDEAVSCRVSVRDINASDLDCRLYVRDWQGNVLVDQCLEQSRLGNGETWLELTPASMGWYEAALEIRSDQRLIVERRRPFVRLPRYSADTAVGAPQTDPTGIGIICEPFVGGQEAICGDLVEALRPAAVKAPIWSSGLGDEEIVRGSTSQYRHLQRLQACGARLIGVLESVPEGLARSVGNGGAMPSGAGGLAAVLSMPPEKWRAHLALPITRYGRFFDAWQIGSDFGAEFDTEQLKKGMENLRREFPSLKILDESLLRSTTGDVRRVPALAAAGSLERLDGIAKSEHPWATIETLPERQLTLMTRLAEYAQKLIEARCMGAKIVFASQPWMLGKSGDRWTAMPSEEFAIQHTLGQVLAGMSPVQRLVMPSGTIAWLWSDSGSKHGAIVAWTAGDGPSELEMILDVGAGARQIDIWGNIAALSGGEGGQTVRIQSMPTIVAPVSPQRALLACGMSIEQNGFTAGVERSHKLTLKNPRGDGLRGELELRVPPGWHIAPERLAIDIPPGKSLETNVAIRVPINEPTGEAMITGRFIRRGDLMHGLVLRSPVVVGPQGLDVNVLTRVEDSGVRVFQRVSSMLDRAVQLRSFAVSDGRQVGGGVFELAAGQSMVREFLVGAADLTTNVPMRVSLEQIGGVIRDNRIVRIESSLSAP